ncbi:MAG: hypothetical protein MZU91_15075 [Desulfosudis oleivorans]|nr:hypothetical protein [Desulfosudis oleivorans]
MQLRKRKEAAESFKKVIQLAPESDWAVKSRENLKSCSPDESGPAELSGYGEQETATNRRIQDAEEKKTFRLFFILGAVLIGGGFLAFMFWALSDTIFPARRRRSGGKAGEEGSGALLLRCQRAVPRPGKAAHPQGEEHRRPRPRRS